MKKEKFDCLQRTLEKKTKSRLFYGFNRGKLRGKNGQ